MGSFAKVACNALDRQSTSSCARAPIKNPPPGWIPLAKFKCCLITGPFVYFKRFKYKKSWLVRWLVRLVGQVGLLGLVS
jgi:hypothetical protein